MSATIIRSIHGISPDHAKAVLAEMEELGAPKLRLVDMGDFLQAIEGTHRLVAAVQLGLVPELEILGADDVVDLSTVDYSSFPGDFAYLDEAQLTCRAGDLAAAMQPTMPHLGRTQCEYHLSEDGEFSAYVIVSMAGGYSRPDELELDDVFG